MRILLGDILREIVEKTTMNNQYPVLTASRSGLFLQNDFFNKQIASKDNTRYKIIRRGQFSYRAMSDTGEFFPNILECVDIGIVSPAYPVFENTQPDKVTNEYLKYYFKSAIFQNAISHFAQGSTRTSLKLNKLKTVTIDVPDVKTQKEMTENLDEIESLLSQRKQQLAMLDELVKAKFIEMFGDPKDNKLKWPSCLLEELFTVGSSKRIYQSEWVSEGIPFLRISDLMNKIEKKSETAELFISEALYEDLKKNHLVPTAGDILVTSRGTLGKCYEIQKHDAFYFQDGMISWLYNRSEKIINAYFIYLFQMPGFRIQIDTVPAGSTVNYLSIARIRKLKIMCPPIGLQHQFANFVSCIDSVKADAERSLRGLDLLKRSLMQEYFS